MLASKQTKLIIFGTGSQARYVLENVSHDKKVKVLGMIDIESSQNVGKSVHGVKIIGSLDRLPSVLSSKTQKIIVAYGNNSKKRDVVATFSKKGFYFYSAVHPHASISSSAKIGSGCIINAGAVVLPDAVISNHVIIHSQCVVEHDNHIGDFSNLAPGVVLAGRVKVGEGATVYSGATAIPGVSIGPWSIVGAGAVVLHDVPPNTTVAGVPAKEI